MNETGPHRNPPDQSSGSGHSFGTPRHPSIIEPILSKRVCFYKSGDPQFGGLRMVVNNRTFKTFDALLDSLSKKVPLPFGVRNITTPRGVHAIRALNELEDGKSYICSDSRRVKPINLAHARKKLPPWYHARPVSSRRWTVQQGQNTHKKQRAVIRTPKRLLVFHNGNPNVKHTVTIRKRTTPTFESVLGHISELVQFHVVKLHTPDGKRVDGLPGLILCSGIVVAAGREPFRPANYKVHKSPVPANQSSLRRLNAFNRKQKPPSYTSQSRRFSPSSEGYIVNQIHDSIAESSCDLPSIPTNSVELESGRVLQSVVETEDGTCLSDGAGGQEDLLPSEDDIEKSFRVNQDGSMTVEMRVRLTIKEEETVQWTTTLSRCSVTNQLSESCFSEPVADLNSPTAAINTDEDKTGDNNDEDLPPLDNGAFSNSNEEDNIKDKTNMVPQRRAPTPGHKLVRRKQTSVESVTSVMAEGLQEDTIGSYSYSQQTDNGGATEQYCMVKQSSTKPVPKPRRLDSVNARSRTVSTVKSAEMLRAESSCDDITETVLHIYEQQTYQDSYLANLGAQGSPVLGIPLTEREERLSVTSKPTLPTFKTGRTNYQRQPTNVIRGKVKPQEKVVNKGKRVSAKAKVTNKHVPQRVSARRRKLKKNSMKAMAKNKKITFSSVRFLKKIYGTKSKSGKKKKKLKKRPTQNGKEDNTTKRSQKLNESAKHIIKAPDLPLALKENPRKAISCEKNMHNGVHNIASQTSEVQKDISGYQESKIKKKSYDNSKSTALSVFSCASSFTNEYVESWLEKSHLNKESKEIEEIKQVQTENSSCGESGNKNSLMEETSEKRSCLITELLAENGRRASVKERVQSFENKSSSHSMEKFAFNNHTTIKNPGNHASLALKHMEEDQPPSSHCCFEMTSRNKNLRGSLSTEQPPPPPPAESMELCNSEDIMVDVPSAVSSPLYRLSSTSSQASDSHPLAVTHTSNLAISPTNHTVRMAASIQNDGPLQRTPSSKRAPLVSNGSLERKMSLRKVRVDKYASCSNAGGETTTSATPINGVGDKVLPDCSTRPQRVSETQSEGNSLRDLKNSPSFCSSACAASSTSEERTSSASVSSTEAPTPNNVPTKEEKTRKASTLTQMEAPSAKTSGTKTKSMSSPSPERRSQTKIPSSELSHSSPKVSIRKHNPDKTLSPNIGVQKRLTPNMSHSSQTKTMFNKPKLQKMPSPHSQSLDIATPPVKRAANKKAPSRNLSSDDASQWKISPERRRHQMLQPAAESRKTLTCDTQMDESQNNKVDKTEDIFSDRSTFETQIMPQQLSGTNQPNMKPVLEEICSSIKSIRQMTESKSLQSPEKSKSLPDFSSHVASTFGSSSKVLLAFLSIMTLKDCITNLNMGDLNASKVSCAEALKMIKSLGQISSIDDSHNLKVSLSNLQQSSSKQLLQCWTSFQDLGNNCKSCITPPNNSGQELPSLGSPGKDRSNNEKVIDEIMERFGMPEKLKEELSSLSAGIQSNKARQSSLSIDVATEDSKHRRNGENKCTLTEPHDGCTHEESQLYSKVLFVDDNVKEMQPCRNTVQEHEKQDHNETKSNRETVKLVASSTGEVEEEDVECEVRRNTEDGHNYDNNSRSEPKGVKFSNSENQCEQERGKKDRSCYYVELNVRENTRISSPKSQNKFLSGEEQPKADCTEMSQDALSHHASLSSSENEQQQEGNEDSLWCKKDEQRRFGLQVPFRDPPDEAKKSYVFSALKEETEEVNSEDEGHYADETQTCEKQSQNTVEGDLGNSVENQDSYTKKDKSDFLAQHCRFSRDSRNNHSSSDECVAVEKPNNENEQISSSNEEELCYYGKQSSSDGEHRTMDMEERCTEYEEASLRKDCEKAVKHPCKEKISQSIAERVILLEKKVADTQNWKNPTTRSPMRRFSQRCTHLDSDGEVSELLTSESALGTRSAPQSSLSFSYDSSGVITTEPEGNRVRSIREMFLAKSTTDIQHGRFPSPNTAELPELRAETSVSGGYQSQTSSDLSGGEDDPARKTITKGFVRRTIERLYGKKDANLDEDRGKMPPSVPKQKAKEYSNIFSPFHTSQAKAMSELSYFSSSNALDTLSEATGCVAFNTQVRPGDRVPIENGRWLLRENTMIRKTVSEPAGINKAHPTFPQGEGMHESTEKTPQSLKEGKSKCTYFSLPHSNDAEVCQEDFSTVTKSGMNGDTVAETKGGSEDTKTRADRNGKLLGVGITEIKMMDNKVHPMIEPPSDGEVVVAQPVRGQGPLNRRLQEPDVLDLLYDFCGQNCPLL